MDEGKATELLRAERVRVTRLLDEALRAGLEDREAANEQEDAEDTAPGLTQEQTDEAVIGGLREHLERIERAEQRLKDGTYGLSIISGRRIPEERLEADPAAETTVEEAERGW